MQPIIRAFGVTVCASLVAALGISGCSLLESEPGLDEVNLDTDRSTYVARQVVEGSHSRYEFDVVARFHNGSGRTVYLDGCGSDVPIYSVELAEPEEGKASGYSPVWGCPAGRIPLSPGESRSDTLHLAGPNSFGSGWLRSYRKHEGRFRLRYPVYTCESEPGCKLPDSLSASDTFEVRLEHAGEDPAAGYAQQIVGSWRWLHSLSRTAGHTIWPETSGHPPRTIEFDENGSFSMVRGDTLAASGRYHLRREDAYHVVEYEVERGAMNVMESEQYVWFDRESTLLLDDAFACVDCCADCFVHAHSRDAP